MPGTRAHMQGYQMETIGQRIARLRVARGMRQSDLAKKVRVTQKAIHTIERDKHGFNVYTFIQLGIVFGVSLDYLAHGDTANADQSNYGSIAGAPTAATGGKSSSMRWRERAD